MAAVWSFGFLTEGGFSMTRIVLSVGCLLALFSSTAAAELSYPIVAPSMVQKESVWMEWLIAAVFVVGCLVIAFKGAKRSNVD
jgi:hypothetical protein